MILLDIPRITDNEPLHHGGQYATTISFGGYTL